MATSSNNRVMVCIRLPPESVELLKKLTKQHGQRSQSELIMLALQALNSATTNADSAVDSAALADRMAALESQLTALNDRVTAIEQPTNSQVASAIKSRPQRDLAPLQAPFFDSDEQCWRWAHEQYAAGYSLKDINASLPEGLRKSNPSRDFKKEWDKLMLSGGNDVGSVAGGDDGIQIKMAVKGVE